MPDTRDVDSYILLVVAMERAAAQRFLTNLTDRTRRELGLPVPRQHFRSRQ